VNVIDNLDQINTSNYKRHPFTKDYSKVSRVLIIFVFLDYFLRRGVFLNSFESLGGFYFIIINIIYFSLFIIFFSIVFYRFYNELFQKNFLIGVVGISMLLVSLLTLFIKEEESNLYKVIVAILFLVMLLLNILIFKDMLFDKNISEWKRLFIIFIFLFSLTSIINSIIYLIPILSFINIYSVLNIQNYFSNVASYSFLIVLIYFIAISFKEIMSHKLYKRLICFLFVTILLMILAGLFSNSLYLSVIYLINALGINMVLPMFIYIYLIFMFITLSLVMLSRKNMGNTIFYIAILILLSGINQNDLYLRVLFIFAITDLSFTLKQKNSIDTEF